MNFKDYFYYDETSPSCLRWAKPSLNYKKDAQDVAGNVSESHGYYTVTFNGKTFLVHRVVFALLNSWFDIFDATLQIDHVNGRITDNHIQNLRVVKCAVNCRNKSKQKNNTSGFTGVSKYVRVDKKGIQQITYRARWIENNIQHGKSFPVSKYGDDALLLAIAYRLKKIQELNNDGAGYTNDHGVRLKTTSDQTLFEYEGQYIDLSKVINKYGIER